MSSGDMSQSIIGFATLAEQVHRKSVKRGFEFTLMVVGETGLGKSTVVNSLFLSDLYADRKIPSVEERIKRTTEIQKTTMEIEEKGVKLRLTIVDTPGFGDVLDGSGSWKACLKYVDDQFASFFEAESGLNRKSIIDSRVHCCLYFIPPYGHGLRQIDLEFIKRLQYKVNVVPVIAKADTLTKAEITKLKNSIMKEIEENDIEIYQFPECDSDEDEEFKSENHALKSSLPFAIVGGTQTMEISGRKVRGRQYPWGFVEVDNPDHSDFASLRKFLIQTHMQDLKDVTHDVHYENYRKALIQAAMKAMECVTDVVQWDRIRVKCLSDLAELQQGSGVTRTAGQLAHLAAVTSSERTRLKRESGVFKSDEKNKSTEILLQEKDEEIKKMQAMLQQMQAKLEATGGITHITQV